MFALILTLCSFGSCNGYVIATDDQWTTQEPCNQTLYVESDLFGKAFTFDSQSRLVALNHKLAQSYLDRFNVREDLTTLTDYDFTCTRINDDEIP